MSINNLTSNPEENYEAIVCHLSTVVFPWDIEKSLEFALYRTYAVPEISRVLVQSGQFVNATEKRYDDTELLLALPMEHGLESEVGTEAIERINSMHQRYLVKNEFYLYVLSTFVLEPIRWLERYGWRPMTVNERYAWFLYYQELGRKMHIQNIPKSLQELERFNLGFEKQHFRYNESNTIIAAVTRDLLLSFYLPKWAVPIGRSAVYALLPEKLLCAFKFPGAPPWLIISINIGLRARARIIRIFPKNKKAKSLLSKKRRSYPMGYALDDLGTLEQY